MMSIIYLHTTIWPSPSPSASFVTYYTHALAQIGVQTELVVQAAEEFTTVENVVEDYFGLKPLSNWKINAIRMKSSGIGRRRMNFYRGIENIIKDMKDKNEPYLIITRSLSLLPIILRFKNTFKGVKILFESHDFFSTLYAIKGKGFQGCKNLLRERFLFPKIDGLICLQKTQIELYRKVFPNLRIFHLPTGCRDFGEIKTEASEKFTAVYVGSFDIHKGVGDLLKIWEGWPDAPALMIIGGRRHYEIETLKRRLTKMKLEDTVTIIPWQKPALMPSYLKKAHVGLLPLQDSFFNRYLTFPLKSMDYIAGGLPVVATSLPTMENIFHHNVDSILLENFETKEFRRTLENLRNNEKLYHGLRENVKILADQFSWKKRAEKMVEILDKKMWHKICI